MKEVRVGVIGAGMRSATYCRSVPADIRPRVRFTALADPNPQHLSAFAEKVGIGGGVRLYKTGAELLAREELDALVIGSPNDAHVADAVPAFGRGIPIVLEKPVAIDLEGCCRLWEAYEAGGRPPVVVGFVLRYTPFYSKLKELVDQGAVGQVLSVDADESCDTGLTNYFYRSPWRRWDKRTGGFMVEKCCHDLDVLSWVSGGKAATVYSVARRTHFTDRPKSERVEWFDKEIPGATSIDYGDEVTRKMVEQAYFGSLYDQTNDLPDHQAVMIAFDNGVISCFTAYFAQPRCTRRMRVAGVGYLHGDIEQGKIFRESFAGSDGRKVSMDTIPVTRDESGHHGGDTTLTGCFWRNAAGEREPIKAGLRDGVEAVLVGLAAERSKHSGEPVELAPLRRQVFGNDAAE